MSARHCRLQHILLLALAPLIWASSIAARSSLPDWAEASLAETQDYKPEGKPDLVVLLSETRFEMSRKAQATITERRLLKVTQESGRGELSMSVPYIQGESDVMDFSIYHRDAQGDVHRQRKSQALDIAAIGNTELFSNNRILVLGVAQADVKVGDCLAVEYRLRVPMLAPTFPVSPYGAYPVARCRLEIEFSKGWSVEHRVFPEAPWTPTAGKNSLTWEWKDLPAEPTEPLAPPLALHQPRLLLTFKPSAKDSVRIWPLEPAHWGDIATYFAPRYAEAACETPELIAKAQALAPGDASSLEVIRALGAYVQSVNYVQVNLNVLRGGGYLPRPAAEVLKAHYGDCKDKATLLMALLRARGIEAYPVLCASGDTEYVYDDWVAPSNFNHCILAVKVDAEIQTQATMTTPEGQRLLIVDATDPHTPIGSLAVEFLAPQALVVAPETRGLLNLTPIAPIPNREQIHTALRLDLHGGAQASLTIETTGSSALANQELRRNLESKDYRALVRAVLSDSIPEISVETAIGRMDPKDGRFILNAEAKTRSFARKLKSGVYAVRPCVFSLGLITEDKEAPRRLPLRLYSHVRDVTTRIELPSGATLASALPEVKELRTDFGVFSLEFSQPEANYVTVRRCLSLQAGEFPAERFNDYRNFLANIAKAEKQALLVQMPKPGKKPG